MKEIWPNFFIVGTSRAGTTSLYNYLERIPEIYLAPKGKTNFFFPEVFHKENAKKEYLSLFKNFEFKEKRGEYAGYLDSQASAQLIKNTVPESKIIICLRNPVERAFSHYLGGLRSNDEIIPFEKAFEKFMMPINKSSDFYNHYIKLGLYYENVKLFLETFGNQNVKIIIFEEFVNETRKIFQEVLNFLDIEGNIPSNVGQTYNEYAEPLGNLGTYLTKNKMIKGIIKKILPKDSRVELLRVLTNKKGIKPKMLDIHRKILEDFYIDDSKKLKGLLKRELPWSFLE